jgi:tRNA pseudouridine38-40 synthase
MGYYKVILAYDGTDYHGWQVQPGYPTLAGALQDCFKEVFHKNINLLGASRTDAGVHALGQVATFTTDFECSAEILLHAWGKRVPPAFKLCSLEEVGSDFHPHKNVAYKIYWYHFFVKRPLPLYARYGMLFEKPFDKEKLELCLQLFVGTHDFRSFCTGFEQENTVRTIYSIQLRFIPSFNVYRIEIKGNGFLRYMIRRIVGACLEIARSDKRTEQDLQHALLECDPLQSLPTAPACGLLLRKIKYHSSGENSNG